MSRYDDPAVRWWSHRGLGAKWRLMRSDREKKRAKADTKVKEENREARENMMEWRIVRPRDATTRGREGSGWRRRVEWWNGEVRGMGGGRRLPRLKWNIDLRRRAQPLQPTRPCPPFSTDISLLWTLSKFLQVSRECRFFVLRIIRRSRVSICYSCSLIYLIVQ